MCHAIPQLTTLARSRISFKRGLAGWLAGWLPRFPRHEKLEHTTEIHLLDIETDYTTISTS